MNIIKYTALIVLAYKIVFFVLSLFDTAQACGALEFCK